MSLLPKVRTRRVAISPHLAQGTTNTIRRVWTLSASIQRSPHIWSRARQNGVDEDVMSSRVGWMRGVGTLVRDGRRARRETMGIFMRVCFLSFGARIFPHLRRPDRVAGMSFAKEQLAPTRSPRHVSLIQPKCARLHQRKDALCSPTAAVSPYTIPFPPPCRHRGPCAHLAEQLQ